ncbi:alpha/beta hydrolase [Alloalcanivorax marinus]|uniref:alpha/beta hydrolase n=1 Tax=Alloalcanivorax marinus TaxID=1177169 RepID=UPI0021D2CAB7|nr:alpha/beta fold hydrolase [Alloalcanivorax marinus]MCU5786498.1 putative hydrolase alpha/beta fold protein [Alloalcanivorax marinus]
MSASRETLDLDGPAGRLRLTLDHPLGAPHGLVLVGHPQPVLGGSPRHPVPHALARALRDAGWLTVRPAFRGVDGSDGEHDDGEGETDDTLVMIDALRARWPDLPLALVGFSFGAWVFARAAARLESPVAALALLGLPVGQVPDGRFYAPVTVPADALLLHGEDDERAPLADLLAHLRADRHPVTVFPGTDHFFKGCLPAVAARVVDHLRLASGTAGVAPAGA